MLQLVRVADVLPDGFAALREAAGAEGHQHLARLAADWQAGRLRFTRPGEALLGAFEDAELVGIGGVTLEPTPAPAPTLRMRRLYVTPLARRRGVARTLANALLQEALQHADLITVHAGNDVAAAFWMALGFTPARGSAWSHELRPSRGAEVA